jgi:hypothetical protein
VKGEMKHRSGASEFKQAAWRKNLCDTCLASYRRIKCRSPIHVTNYSDTKSVSDPRTKVTSSDYVCDIELAARKVTDRMNIPWLKFTAAYLSLDLDGPEQERFADTLFNDRNKRALLENKLGQIFQDRRLHPKRYFYQIRKGIGEISVESESDADVSDKQQEMSATGESGDSFSLDYADPETAALVEQAYLALDASLAEI